MEISNPSFHICWFIFSFFKMQSWDAPRISWRFRSLIFHFSKFTEIFFLQLWDSQNCEVARFITFNIQHCRNKNFGKIYPDKELEKYFIWSILRQIVLMMQLDSKIAWLILKNYFCQLTHLLVYVYEYLF